MTKGVMRKWVVEDTVVDAESEQEAADAWAADCEDPVDRVSVAPVGDPVGPDSLDALGLARRWVVADRDVVDASTAREAIGDLADYYPDACPVGRPATWRVRRG